MARTGRPLKFKNEKAYCDYIEQHIGEFCGDVLECELITYKRESYIQPKRFGANKARVDFEILTTNGIFLVECKLPKQVSHEMTRAISQLLSYAVIAEPQEVKLVLVTNATIPLVQQTILKFELPIMVALIDGNVIATWDMMFQEQLNAGEIQVGKQYAIS